MLRVIVVGGHALRMQTGDHGPYRWLETDHDLHEFISLCPSVIVGRHLAITAVDSGSFRASELDRATGWSDNGGIAYSPRLDSTAALPSGRCCRDCCGCDEWYLFVGEPKVLGSICHTNVFDAAVAPPNVFQFINFVGFRLSDPQMKAITDRFWRQLEWIQPESYVADGDSSLVFVSSNREVFGSVYDALSKSPSRNQ